jgi:hypothetical protein
MNEREILQGVADAAAGKQVENAALADMMQKAREAQSRSSNMLEDLAREIQSDERALQAKIARFEAIVAEQCAMPDRIRNGAQ